VLVVLLSCCEKPGQEHDPRPRTIALRKTKNVEFKSIEIAFAKSNVKFLNEGCVSDGSRPLGVRAGCKQERSDGSRNEYGAA
jgi:hypothetical protein